MAQFRHRLRLDLTNTFTGDLEPIAEFFERLGFIAVKSEAEHENVALALVKRGERDVQVRPVVVELRFDEATLESGSATVSRSSRSSSWASDSESGSGVIRSAAATCSSVIPVASAICARLGSRPLPSRDFAAVSTAAAASPTRVGTRIVRPFSAIARPIAWRIHHVA